MISTTGGSSCCTRKASMIATMENHCQRVRRNLSSRFEGRNKLPKLAFWFEPCGARARMHTRAKNPAGRSSSNASLSNFFSKPWESTLLVGKTPLHSPAGGTIATSTGHRRTLAKLLHGKPARRSAWISALCDEGKSARTVRLTTCWWILWSDTTKVKFKLFMNLIHNL